MLVLVKIMTVLLLLMSLGLLFFIFYRKNVGRLPQIVGVVGALLGVVVIILSFKVPLPWYIIVLLFLVEMSFIGSAIPFENSMEKTGIGFSFATSLLLVTTTVLMFLA